MSSFAEHLVRAAQRGIEVTVITNDHPPVALRLQWHQTITSMNARVRTRAAGYELFVRDCDGDFSTWSVKRHGLLIAKGTEGWAPGEFYHCDAACLAAEKATFEDARRRIAAVRQ